MNIVLFDGICNLCNSTVSFLIKYDTNNNLHFAAQQTETGKKIMMQYDIKDDNKSVILIKHDKVFYKSNAIIEITTLLSGWPRILKYSKIIPGFIRDALYDLIAKYRYGIFGKKDKCSVPSQATLKKFL